MRNLFFPLTVVGVFLACAFVMLTLRLEKGDMYPAFSSLRADPIGSRALYESLERQKGLTVGRNFVDVADLTVQGTTLFFIGLSATDLQNDSAFAASVTRLASRGNRVVLALDRSHTFSADSAKGTKRTASGLLGLYCVPNPAADSPAVKAPATLAPLRWKSDVAFRGDSTWTGIVAENDNRIIVGEKRILQGTLVALCSSFHLSNEGLRDNSRTLGSNPLIPFLVGSSRTVLFDESHNGIAYTTGLADLFKKFGMTGVVLFALVWFLFFIWTAQGTAAGRSSAERTALDTEEAHDSLTHLLSSHIPFNLIFDTCKEEWTAAFPQKKLADAAGTTDVENYNALCKKPNFYKP
jgi:hypothetical protein